VSFLSSFNLKATSTKAIDNYYEKEKNTKSLPEFFVMLQELRDNIDRQEGCFRTQVVEDDTEQVSGSANHRSSIPILSKHE
jgi:hypothetical protein